MRRIEKEISFLINSYDIDKILEIINEIGSKYNFVTGEKEIQTFNDFYFDKGNLDLGKRKIALRLRVFDDKTSKLTLKKTKKDNELFSKRLELEDFFSKNILDSVIHFLEQNGLHLDNPLLSQEEINKMQPESVLNLLGFKTIQTRNTERQSIIFYKDSKVIYEFAIDKTFFIFSNKEFKYTTMEIESMSNENTLQTDEGLVSCLINNSGQNSFRIWKFNKLVTGFAILELFSTGILTEQYIDENRFLKTDAMDIIEKYLQKSLV